MRLSRWLAALGVAFWAAIAPAVAESALRLQQAASSRVVLALPAGYQASPLFTGFLNEVLGVSLVIVELPAPAYEQLASGLTAEALAAKGIVGATPHRLERAEPYLYLRAEQASEQGPMAKFLLAIKDRGIAALVTANVRRASLEQGLVTVAEIERLLASAQIVETAAPARDAFRLGYLGDFKAAGSILGTTRAFTLDGRMEPAARGERRTVLVVAPSLDRRPVPDAELLAEKLLAGLPSVDAVRIAESRRLEIAGRPALETRGSIVERDGRGETAVWQMLVLPREGGYYRLLAQMPAADAEHLLPQLRRIAQGFEPVE